MGSSNTLAEMLRQQQLLQQMNNPATMPNPNQFTTQLQGGGGSSGGSSTGMPGAADYTGLPPARPRGGGGGGTTTSGPVSDQSNIQGTIANSVAPLYRVHSQLGNALNKITGGVLGAPAVGGMGSQAPQQAMNQMPNPITGMGMQNNQMTTAAGAPVGPGNIAPPPSQPPIPGTPAATPEGNPALNPQGNYGFTPRPPVGPTVPPDNQGTLYDPTKFPNMFAGNQ